MRPIGPKLSNMLSTPKAKKIIRISKKSGEILGFESGKFAGNLLFKYLTKDPTPPTSHDKIVWDTLELFIRFPIALFKSKGNDEKFQKMFAGNPLNMITDGALYLVNGWKKSKEIITSSFK